MNKVSHKYVRKRSIVNVRIFSFIYALHSLLNKLLPYNQHDISLYFDDIITMTDDGLSVIPSEDYPSTKLEFLRQNQIQIIFIFVIKSNDLFS